MVGGILQNMAKKKRKKAKKFNPKTRVMSAMRKIWLWSPMRKEVVTRCKTGENFRCEKCRRLSDKIQVDHHPLPVVLLTGWDSWDGVFSRMFVDPGEGLRGLCETCHDKHTATQKENRKKYKKLCQQ